MTQKEVPLFGQDGRPPAAQQPTDRRQRRRSPTLVGLLEALMWAGGAGIMLGFWLWPGPSEAPAKAKVRMKVERPTDAAVLRSPPPKPDPANRELAEWLERFRTATEQAAVTAEQDETSRPPLPGSNPPPVTIIATVSAPGPAVQSNEIQTTESATEETLTTAAVIEPVSQDTGRVQPSVASDSPTLIEPDHERLLHAHSESPDALQVAAVEPITGASAGAQPQTAPDPEQEPFRDMLSAELDIPSQPQGDMLVIGFASAPSEPPQEVLPPGVPELPRVPAAGRIVPTVAPEAAVPEQSQALADAASASPAGPPHVLQPANRDGLVAKGEELLARGDVSGARLFFRRAAESGDARAAIGMAHSFDPEALRKLRVYGVRPDREQAAYWYNRSKALQAVASTR